MNTRNALPSTYQLVSESRAAVASLLDIPEENWDSDNANDVFLRIVAARADLAGKVENIHHVRQRIEAERNLLAQEERRLRTRRRRLADSDERLDALVLQLLEAEAEATGEELGDVRIDGATCSVKVSYSERVVVDVRPSLIPDVFRVEQDPKPNKHAIKAALKIGQGTGWAHLERRPYLRWK